jgi:hypothetical protein
VLSFKIWYQSLAPLIRLYPSEIFVSCCFRKNSLVSNFFYYLILQHIKKIVILFAFCPKYISCLKKKQVVQKDIYWFLPQKIKQGKIGSNQLRIISNLIILFLGSESHCILILGSIGYRFLWVSNSGLIKSNS